EGLAVPALEPATVATLEARLASFASSNNPVDVTAQLFAIDQPAEGFAEVCATVGHDDGVDAVLVVLTNVLDEAAVRVCEAIRPSAGGGPAGGAGSRGGGGGGRGGAGVGGAAPPGRGGHGGGRPAAGAHGRGRGPPAPPARRCRPGPAAPTTAGARGRRVAGR